MENSVSVKPNFTNEGLTFNVRDRTLAIATDDLLIQQFVREAYGRILSCQTGLSVKANDLGRILMHGSTPLLAFNGEERPWPPEMPATPTAAHIAFYGSRELFRLSAAELDACWPVYGAGVAIHNRAVVILGASGSGKTTLSLALVDRGALFYGDECIFIDNVTSAVDGLSRSLMIREPSLDLLNFIPCVRSACASGAVIGESPNRLWYAVEPDDVFGRPVHAAPLPLRAVIMLDDCTAAGAEMTQVPSSLAALFVTRNSHVRATSLSEIADASRVLAGVACYRLRSGTPADTAALVLSTLEAAT